MADDAEFAMPPAAGPTLQRKFVID